MNGNGVAMNPFIPYLARITETRDETLDVRTLRLEFIDPDVTSNLEWRAGQFGHFSIFGQGESVFTITNAPTRRGFVECTFRDVGKVTNALRALSLGQTVGFRGPYGNWFPMEEWIGKDLIFVGGGLGMAALHAPLQLALDNRSDYGEILVLNGARTVADIVYHDEMKEWEAIDGVRVVQTVDPGGEADAWDGEVGLIPDVFKQLAPSPDGSIVITCGPPVMLHFMLIALEELGFSPQQIVTTLENKMKCGIGQCGRCNVGPFFVCKDGPVVTAAQLQALPSDI
jgi:NAD(P)H-flavin reductase